MEKPNITYPNDNEDNKNLPPNRSSTLDLDDAILFVEVSLISINTCTEYC